MKLVSFAVVSLLAITVSAQSPPRPSTSKDTQDTQDTQEPMDLSTHGRHQSQGAAAQNIPQSQSPQELMDDSSQDSHQSQGTAVQDMLQFLDAATQDIQRYMNAAAQDRHQSQDAAAQNIPQSQSAQEPQGAATQTLQQFMDTFAQDILQHVDVSSQGRQQSQGAATQDIPQPMDAAARDIQKLQSASTRILHRYMGASAQILQQSRNAQQADQDRVKAEVVRLEGNYKKQYDIFSKIDRNTKIERLRSIKIKEMMNSIVVKLKGANLDGNEESRLTRLYADLKLLSGEFDRRYRKQQLRYETAIEELDDARAELQILKINQALLAKHNADQWTHMSPLSNSLYNIEILQKQYFDAIKEIGVALEKQKNINAAESTHGNVLEAQKEAIKNRIRDLQSYSEVLGNILWEYKYSMSMTQWISNALNPHAELPNITN